MSVIPLRRQSDRFREQVAAWRVTRPLRGESWRWECADGRWVSVLMGEGDELGHVVLRDSEGRRVLMDSVEEALAVARNWRI